MLYIFFQLEHTFGADHITGTDFALNPPRTSRPNSNSQRLKRALRPVMVIVAVGAANVKGNTSRLRKALQTVRNHLRAEVADLFAFEANVDDCPWPARKINDCPRESLVQRGIAAAESREGLPGS